VAAETTKSSAGEEAGAESGKKAPQDDIDVLVKQGNRHIQERQWDLALDAWKRVGDLNPFHPQARKAVNQISVWKEHKEILRKAQQASDDERYGEAAKLLRQIDDASEYYREAKSELKNLDTMKDSLVNMANTKVTGKDCSGALMLFEQAQAIDPRDAEVAKRIMSTKKKQGRKCP
jgi:tetratricopeptide (TPR) repeat protein